MNVPAPKLAPGTRDRVIEESCGNPLALLELPRTDLPAYDRSPLPLPARIQQAYAVRIAELPPEAQKALLITALTDGGDLDVIVRAGRELGIAPAALGVAERSGLVRVDGGRVAFTHPLMRAAAFRQGTYDLRLEVHAILARLLEHQPDRRAWHLAAAATGPDETAALALEQVARRARERDGNAGACAALERAAELTEDHALKAGRLTEAAVAAADAGQAGRAKELVERAAALVTDPRSRARLCDLRARIAFDEGAPHLAHDLLMAGAEELAALTTAEGCDEQARQDRIAAGLMLTDAARNAWQLSDPARVAEAAERLHKLGLRPEDGCPRSAPPSRP
ncbi:hypothetical protein IL992_04780 [Microbispora sp. NEAU-D428]|uniref:hypothetical protein n=1 Tax=Microbispora sitophila TaxID=2771537 RepID=UPI0018668FFE|nr:hypothetical protein [Microbispora sitophila]MBE3008502.1 hypothetical protein [Microbispora sitophila]